MIVMLIALRKIDRKVLWDKTPSNGEKAWLAVGELRADALEDISTDDNRLSIYVLEDGVEVTIERVVGAIAATREHIAKLDYVTFDPEILGELNLEVEPVLGKTLDPLINSCHRDLIHLTATKLANLGNTMQQRGEVKRKQPNVVGRLINASL